MIDRITFIGEPTALSPYSLRDVPPSSLGCEVMEVRLQSAQLRIAMHPAMYVTCPRKETREEHGRRLRYAAAEFARSVEQQLLEKLKTMGHLV